MSAALRNAMVEIARAEIGVKSSKNNVGPLIEAYQAATYGEPGAWPWCAAFTAWVLREGLKTPAGVEFMLAKGITDAEAWRCKTGVVFTWSDQWGPKRATMIMPPALPQPGDFVVFNVGPNGHIGICSAPSTSSSVKTIDGNVGGNTLWTMFKDCVAEKTRSPSKIRASIRIE